MSINDAGIFQFGSGEKGGNKRLKNESSTNLFNQGPKGDGLLEELNILDNIKVEENPMMEGTGQINQNEESKIINNQDQTVPFGDDQKALNLKRPVRKWEKRWILQPNVLDIGNAIWI